MPKIKRDKADELFSLYVRYRDGWKCQRCGRRHEVGSQGLHASHFHGRGKENTRFDPVNVIALCYGCHMYFTAHPQEHRDWQLQRMGKKEYNALLVRANTYKKKDRKMERIIARELLRSVAPTHKLVKK